MSYNGIRERAQNVEVLARIDAYTKALQIYKAQNGTYPAIVEAETGYANSACLGSASEYPADTNFGSNICYKEVSPSRTISTSATLNSQLQSVISPLPKGSATLMVSGDSNLYMRGVLLTNIGTLAFIQYFTEENQPCGRGTATAGGTTFPGTTLCQIILP